MMREQGHKFLARLGKTKLRPGGEVATSWLLDYINVKEDTKLLEVACNMGTTLARLAGKYDIELVGVDKDTEALQKAKTNIETLGYSDKIKLFEANALNLPFEDESFDYVLNEAMLTMLSDEEKAAAIKEYYRVLKPGGVLLTHDIILTNELPQIVKHLQNVIGVPAKPLILDDWINLYKQAKFEDITYTSGIMKFLNDDGLVADEGVEGKIRILENAKNDHNYSQFLDMRKFFNNNKDRMHYIAFKCDKKI